MPQWHLMPYKHTDTIEGMNQYNCVSDFRNKKQTFKVQGNHTIVSFASFHTISCFHRQAHPTKSSLEI